MTEKIQVIPAEQYLPSVGPGANARSSRLVVIVAGALLALAFAALFWVSVLLYGAAFRGSEDAGLRYADLEAELVSILRHDLSNQFHDDVRVDVLPAVIIRGARSDTIAVDTISVLRTTVTPSLAPAGFLADEIARFNLYQRTRLERFAELPPTAPLPFDLIGMPNSSVLRTARLRTAEGDTVLIAQRPNVRRLQVASPFEALQNISVTAREPGKGLALVNAAGAARFSSNARTPGANSCMLVTTQYTTRVHCMGTALAAEREAEFDFSDPFAATGRFRVFRGSQRYDGVRQRRGDDTTVQLGGLFQFDVGDGKVTPGLILERTTGGAIVGTQWVNGQLQWRTNTSWDTPLARQIATAIGGNAGRFPDRSVIPLSLDEPLTRAAQGALEDFVRASPETKELLRFANLVVADMRTGEVLGVAEVNSQPDDDQSWLFRPVNVGSAIKPILATGILLRRPELASLEIDNVSPVASLWGLPLAKPFATGCRGVTTLDLRMFIGCSSNLYAATLVAAGLLPDTATELRMTPSTGMRFRLDGHAYSNQRVAFPIVPGGIEQLTLARSSLAEGLLLLDSLTTVLAYARSGGVEGRDSSIWRGLLDDQSGRPISMPPSMWVEESRLGLTGKDESASLRALAGYAIGSGENQISPIRMTEAFARIVSDRQVSLTMVPTHASTIAGTANRRTLDMSAWPWHRTLLLGLYDVANAKHGTARNLGPRVEELFGPPVRVYAKTGTLNEPADSAWVQVPVSVVADGRMQTRMLRTLRVIPPVVAKSLAFAVGQTPSPGTPMTCGVAGFLYFRFRDENDRLSGLDVRFINIYLLRVLQENWARLGICASR